MSTAFTRAVRETTLSVVVKTGVLALAIAFFFLLRSMHAWHDEYAPSTTWVEALRARGGRMKPWAVSLARAAALLPPDQTYREFGALAAAVIDKVDSLPTPLARAEQTRAKYIADQTALKAVRDEFRSEADRLHDEFEADRAHEGSLRSKLAAATTRDSGKAIEAEQKELADAMEARTTDRRRKEEWYQRRIADLQARIDNAKTAMRAELDAASLVVVPRPIPPLLAHDDALSEFLLKVGDSTDSLHGVYTAIWYGLQLLVAFLFYLVLRPIVLAIAGSSDAKGLFEAVKKWLVGSFVTGGRAAGNALIGVTAVGLAVTATSKLVGQPLHTELPPPTITEVHKVYLGQPGEPGTDGKAGADGKPGEQVLPEELKLRLQALEETRMTLQQTIEAVRHSTERVIADVEKLQGEKLPLRVGELEGRAAATNTNLQILGEVSGSLTQVTTVLATVNKSLADEQRAVEQSVASQLPAIAKSANDASEHALEARKSADRASEKTGKYAENVDHLLDQGTFWDDRGFWASLIPFERYAAGPGAIHLVDHDLCQRKLSDGARKVVTAAMADASTEQRYRWGFRRAFLDAAVVRVRAGEATATEVEEAVRAEMPLIMKVSRVPR